MCEIIELLDAPTDILDRVYSTAIEYNLTAKESVRCWLETRIQTNEKIYKMINNDIKKRELLFENNAIKISLSKLS